MTKLTENFTLEEFACHDGSKTPQIVINHLTDLAQNLEVLRLHTGPIKIMSGYRSPAHNKSVGGAKNSQHLLGNAGDLKVKGMTPKQVADYIEELIASGDMKQGGIGIYPTFTHYDIRGIKARW